MVSAPPEARDGLRRVCVVTGTQEYGAGLDPLPYVPQEVALVRSVFKDIGLEVLDDVPLDPTPGDLKRAVGRAMGGEEDGAHPNAVVLYYSAHGYTTNADYRLATFKGTCGTSEDFATSISAHEIASLVNQPGPDQVVVMFDACESGSAGDAFLHLEESIAKIGNLGPDVYLITAAGRNEEAQQLAFADAFSASLKSPGVPNSLQYVEAAVLCRDMNHRLGGAGQSVLCHTPSSVGKRPLRAFPNPRFRKRRPQYMPEATEGFGWAFCGRKRALGELVPHVSGTDPDRRPVVVTGHAGSGKSTLLAALAAASDGQPLPTAAGSDVIGVPPGSVALVQAYGLVWDLVLEEIGNELGVPYRDDPEAFFRALDALPAPRGLLIDSVNRVGPTDAVDVGDPTALQEFIEKVLLPLSAIDTIRLVVAAETPLSRLGAREIPLAGPEYFDPEDVELLSRTILAGRQGSLHKDMPQQHLEHLAAGVRERSQTSFLRAYLFSIDLAGREPTQDEAAVQTSVVDVFEQQLARVERDDPAWAKDLLTPLALALGAGMPNFSLWIDVVQRLTARRVDHDALDRLLHAAEEFITDAQSSANTAGWRLRREEFASFLAQQYDTAQAHAAFTSALVEALGTGTDRKPQWSAADDYTRRNFAEHAQRAGLLDDFLTDPDFLLSVDPLRLRRALTLAGTPRARAVRELMDLLRSSNREDEADVSRLEFLAQAHQQTELARNTVGKQKLWNSTWVHRVPTDAVTGVPVVRGGNFLVVGTQDGGALVGERDRLGLRELEAAGDPVSGVHDPVSALSAGLLNGKPFAALGTWNGGVVLHDLGTGQRYAMDDPRPFADRIVACEVGDNGLLVATAHAWRRYGLAGVSDLPVETGGLVLASVATLALPEPGWTVGCSSREVAVWAPDGTLQRAFITPQRQALTHIASYEGDVLTASNDGTVYRSSPYGTDQHCITRHEQPVTSMKVRRIAEGALLLTTSLDGTVRLTPLDPARPGLAAVSADLGIQIKAADLEGTGRLVVCTNRGTARITF
ncbi:caspase family protein [Streptomyces virginiae]|uniref:caspase family protein n=1 Tax=Streptomyces virginiae TaxID=1961 RepID=UPI00380CBC34